MFLVVPNSATCLVCAIYNKYNYAEHQHFVELWTNFLCCASVCSIFLWGITVSVNRLHFLKFFAQERKAKQRNIQYIWLCFSYTDYLYYIFTLKLFNPLQRKCPIFQPLGGSRSFQMAHAGNKGWVGGVRHQIFKPTLLKKASGVWAFLKQDRIFTAWASYFHTITNRQTNTLKASLIQVSVTF